MNIGIIGCGNIAQSHATILRKNISNSRLIFCDRNRYKAENLAERFFPGPTYLSIDELLSTEKLDAVHIVTQVFSHKALAEKAFDAGVHVYVEKPVTEQASEYNELLELAKSKKKVFCAGYSTLGIPVVRRAKQIITSGNLGRLLTIHCDFNWSSGGGIPYSRADHWAYSLKGGILQNLIDHPTSLVVDAMDDIHDYKVLFGRRNTLPKECADLVHVSVSNGHQLGSYTVSFGHGNTCGNVSYSLEKATIAVDLRRDLLAIIPERNPMDLFDKILLSLSGLKLSWDIGRGTVRKIAGRLTGYLQREPGIAGLISNFYRAIDGKETLIVSERTASRTMGLLEHIWEEMGSTRGDAHGSA